MGKTIFSGVQPSGDLHLGNYLGAFRRWVNGQNDGLNIFCVVDMHAITIPQDPEILKGRTLDIAAFLIACGIDPEKSILFIQSHNPDHANLSWILNCYLSMGQMSRMTQFKEKSENKDFVSVGLFDYPALMAADILLYDTTEVPVGEDQKQHVELARDVAARFNSKYGETFVLPEPMIAGTGARIMGLVDPTKKMGKSDSNPNSRINLIDSKDEIIKKVKSATTDSGSEIKYDPKEKPGISNLLQIYSTMKEITLENAVSEFQGKNYGEFKETVAESVVEILSPMQEKYREIRNSSKLAEVLVKGVEKAREISGKKLKEVYEKVGFYL
jgi:tryptophanyl-tRNA synthetase